MLAGWHRNRKKNRFLKFCFKSIVCSARFDFWDFVLPKNGVIFLKSQQSKVNSQRSTVSRFFYLSLFATKTITENPKGKGGQNDRIGGQDHRVKQ
jgi:hypothetical protein